MHLSSNSALWAASTLLWAASTSAQQAPSPTAQLNAMTYKGCFSSSDPLTSKGGYQFQTQGYCQTVCAPLGKAVMGLTSGDECWCGDKLPASSSKVSDSECNQPCKGFNKNECGGSNKWTVYLTGTNNNVGSVGGGGDDDSSSIAPSPTQKNGPSPKPTKAPVVSVITVGGQTQTVTQPNAQSTGADGASPSPSKKSSPASTAGIAAGVVVGVVLVGAAIGGAFFFLRRRKRRAIEDEYRRNAAANSLGNGGKPGSASSISDSRLEPSVMMQRRMSDGSMADNQDYSRRILKVTNPEN
ncbi:MAG: hypothetical protein M4579_003597 [Chaenotheca gracillima]|nr:MAG: hypothetical protein M4579_003597 [Chaenotheca gracillima]